MVPLHRFHRELIECVLRRLSEVAGVSKWQMELRRSWTACSAECIFLGMPLTVPPSSILSHSWEPDPAPGNFRGRNEFGLKVQRNITSV